MSLPESLSPLLSAVRAADGTGARRARCASIRHVQPAAIAQIKGSERQGRSLQALGEVDDPSMLLNHIEPLSSALFWKLMMVNWSMVQYLSICTLSSKIVLDGHTRPYFS